MEKTLGQIAYEAYCKDCGNKSIRGEELPTWEAQANEIKQHWEAAGLATCKVGGNYVTDREGSDIFGPKEVMFVNGRKVKIMPENWDEEVYLEVI